VNLAYEAATADLEDVNMIDPFHLDAYGETAVNYNRDIEIFPVMNALFEDIYGEAPYKSPTDMGVNMIGYCISDDEVCCEASRHEIIRRYFTSLCNFADGKATEEEVNKIALVMKRAKITVNDRKCTVAARERLEKAADERGEAAFENEVIETICENAKVDIPEAMIEDQIDNMLRDMEMRMAYQGIKLDDYFKYTGQTREQVREMYRAQAEERVKTQLVMEAVRKAENIEATDEETDAEIAKYAEQNKKTLDEFKKVLSDDDRKLFADGAAMQKTLDFIKANAE
jgi:hypothetical protein